MRAALAPQPFQGRRRLPGQRRLGGPLGQFRQHVPRRQLRAVELLERIATPAARDVLSELAKGAAEAPLTREAAAALERLRRPGRTQAK